MKTKEKIILWILTLIPVLKISISSIVENVDSLRWYAMELQKNDTYRNLNSLSQWVVVIPFIALVWAWRSKYKVVFWINLIFCLGIIGVYAFVIWFTRTFQSW